MPGIPTELLEAIPPGGRETATAWWQTFSDEQRSQIAELWDNRVEICFFDRQADASGKTDDWSQVPAVQGGRFVPHDSEGRDEWEPGYFEHLLAHPELMIAYQPAEQTFHIGCTVHAAARRCLANGSVPADFNCPLIQEACPFQRLRGSQFSGRAADRR